MKRAAQAKESTDKVAALEQIQMEVLGSWGNDLTLDVNKLKTNLAGIGANVAGDDFPLTVTLNDNTFTVDSEGKVSSADGVVLSSSTLNLQILTNGSNTTKGEETLNATLVNISGSISWSSNNSSVITVTPSADGKSATITANQAGNAKVIATCSGYTAECNVVVNNVTAVTSITLDNTSKSVAEGDEFTITATTNGNEDLTWEWAKTSGDTALTITTSGEGKKVGTIVAQGAGTATVTVSAPNATAKTCTVTVTSPYIDNSYVQYNVEYKDAYTGTQYTRNTGWRLLTDLSSYESTGTYQGNIEIISTGIPAKLYYYYDTVKNFEIESDLSNATKGKWAGNSAQRTQFLTDYNYSSHSASDYNIHAASGLLYNFKNVVFSVTGTTSTLTTGTGNAFKSTDTRNYGGYIEIKKNESAVTASSTTTAEDLFKANVASGTVTGMRSVNLKDIKGTNDDSDTATITDSTDQRPGLFMLNSYTPDRHTGGYYWLASPSGSSYLSLRYVDYIGYIDNDNYDTYGVRPVVSISNVKLRRNGHVWEIVE